MIGDDDGLAVIPHEGAEEVLECSREKLNAEDSVREEVLEGEYLYELNGYDELFDNLTIVGPEDSIQ